MTVTDRPGWRSPPHSPPNAPSYQSSLSPPNPTMTRRGQRIHLAWHRRVESHEARTTNHEPRTTNHEPRTTNHWWCRAGPLRRDSVVLPRRLPRYLPTHVRTPATARNSNTSLAQGNMARSLPSRQTTGFHSVARQARRCR
ncbi:hypothetical protein PMIN03_013116 [Paraphaeosphaeria minitans]